MIERNAGLPPERRIEFRVGIHLGDVVEESDGDLMGDSVNIAARSSFLPLAAPACLPRQLPRRSIAPRCRRSSSTGSSPGPLSTTCRARHGGPDCRNSACPTHPIR